MLPSHDNRCILFTVQCRSMQTALSEHKSCSLRAFTSLRYLCPIISYSMSATLPYMSVHCPTKPYIFSMPSFYTSKTAPFQGHTNSFLVTSLGGRVRAKRFYSLLGAMQWRLKSTLSFPSCFLYNPTFRKASISHQLQLMVL